jgi:hypothetical protein
MADIEKLKGLLDAYGVGVRAGVITPCLADENAFRKMLGLEAAPAVVEEAWSEQGGIRTPVTLQKSSDIEEGAPTSVAAFPSEDTD